MESETLSGRELGQLFLEARRRRGNIDSGPETTLEPFQFFELPDYLQRQIMIEELSLESIKNLCATAATSKQFQSFLRDICNNVEVWRSKFKYDFPDVYPESLRAAEGENINDLVRYWREEYEAELRDTPFKMIEYIENNDILKVRKYLRLGVDTEQLIPYTDIQQFYEDSSNLEDLPKVTLLTWAVFLGRKEIIEDLIEAGADPNEGEGELLLVVNDEATLQELVNLGLNIKDYGGNILANRSEDYSRKEIILQVGLQSPLLKAAANNDIETVEMLLNQGADIDTQDEFDGWTPLMAASFEAHVDLVRFLLENGANPRLRSFTGKTAYDWQWRGRGGVSSVEIQFMLREAMKK